MNKYKMIVIVLLVVIGISILIYKDKYEHFVPYYQQKTNRWSTGADPLSYYEYNIYRKPYRHPFKYQTSYPYPYRKSYPYSAN